MSLAEALALRALVRATAATALTGVVAGLLATTFLALSGSRLDATTVPVVTQLLAGQLAGLAAAAACARRLRALRAGRTSGPRAAGGAAHDLDRLLPVLVAAAGVLLVALPFVVRPAGAALLSSVIGAGVLAQVVVVIAVARGPLRRAARAEA